MISVSDLFIRRPVMTVLVMLTILLFGLIAYKQLPVSDLPNVDYPTINVTATLPGASPDTMASIRRHRPGKGVLHASPASTR